MFGRELFLRGAEERLAPILMTAACAALALLPLVLKGNAPGHEIEYPMAVVILGGLATSTLLNLFLIPSLYARFGRSRIVPSEIRAETATAPKDTADVIAPTKDLEAVRRV